MFLAQASAQVKNLKQGLIFPSTRK